MKTLLRKVAARIPQGDKTATITVRGAELVVSRYYTEVLDCGCERQVGFRRKPGLASGVYFKRRPLFAQFDPVKHLGPERRTCERHSQVEATEASVRAEYLTRMRSFNSHLRQRAKVRGLAFP